MKGRSMSNQVDDERVLHMAMRIADCLAAQEYAFVEDDKVPPLAEALQLFLTRNGIPINPTDTAGPSASDR